MPTDPSIMLAGKPPVIPELDLNSTFRTLGQLKALQATTQAKEQEAARAQALFDETGAGRGLLSSLGTGPASAAPPAAPVGGPPFDEATLAALPQGGSTPPPRGHPGCSRARGAATVDPRPRCAGGALSRGATRG